MDMKNIKSKRTALREGFITRALMLVLLLAILGGALTGCVGGTTTHTLTASSITADDVTTNGLSKDNLSILANDIIDSKNAWQIREQLVAALNGYDMTAEGCDDDLIEGLLVYLGTCALRQIDRAFACGSRLRHDSLSKRFYLPCQLHLASAKTLVFLPRSLDERDDEGINPELLCIIVELLFL